MPHTAVASRWFSHPLVRLGFFLLILAGVGSAGAALFFLLGIPPQRQHGVLQPLPLLATGVLAVGVILAATLIALKWIERRPLRTLGLPAAGTARALLAGLGFGAIVPLFVTAVMAIAGYAVVTVAHLSADQILRATLPMVLATALLSTWEEIAFRGYLLQLIARMGGPLVGVTVTGVLFGLAHGGNPGANLLGFLNTALNGALLGLIVARTGSLWLACGYHAGWNLAAAMLMGLRDSGTTAPGALFSTTLNGPVWLSGGEYGFEASVLTGCFETLLLAAMLWVADRLPSVSEAQPFFNNRLP